MGIILGTLGDDNLKGTDGIDVITALSGNDVVVGGDGADVISGDDGNDILYADTQQSYADGDLDTVMGGAGDDFIYGGYGDILNGGTGFDVLGLDLSESAHGVSVNFKPMTLLDLSGLLTLKIDNTELSGFEAVGKVIGTGFADRIALANSAGYGSDVDAGAGNDVVRGNRGDDTILGGDGNDKLQGRAGHDVVDGGVGNDRISGGASSDTLTGGAGADLFVFAEGDTRNGRAHADVIKDFSHDEGDRISLRGIDAIVGGGDDAFSFIGTDKFSGTAGELRFGVVGGHTFITGDTNGDGQADFTIRLDGAIDLVKSDFQF